MANLIIEALGTIIAISVGLLLVILLMTKIGVLPSFKIFNPFSGSEFSVRPWHNQLFRVRGTERQAVKKGKSIAAEWIGALTEMGLILLALAIVLTLFAGSELPFFGGTLANIVGWVSQIGSLGLMGLIALGIVLWLFSGRSQNN